jgi:hydrogenase-4 component F
MSLPAQFPPLIPLLALGLTLALRGGRSLTAVAVGSAVALWLFALWAILARPLGLWDALALWFLLLVSILAGFCLLASAHYLREELRAGEITLDRARRYFLLFHACVASLLVIGTAADYFVIWAAVEGTTLSTVALITSTPTERSVEAAWKYIVVTGIGGLLALLGTTLVLRGAQLPLTAWGLALPARAAPASGVLGVQVGFWLALIGYGSKSGLVPAHTWLPDAHSEAPAPVSGLLSGIKLVGGVYALLRLLAVVSRSLGRVWPHDLLIGIGLASLALAAAAIAGQRDLKRLLAYSSIEHMGIVALGAGFGGWGLAGALLHMWTHGLAKTSLFFGSGNVRLRYGTTEAPRVRGVLAALPVSGAVLALGGLAIAGLPPFGLFWSEWLVLLGGVRAGDVAVVAVALALLLLAFVALGRRLPGFLLGGAPTDVAAVRGAEPALATWPLWVELGLLVVVGLLLPSVLNDVWFQAVRLGGG